MGTANFDVEGPSNISKYAITTEEVAQLTEDNVVSSSSPLNEFALNNEVRFTQLATVPPQVSFETITTFTGENIKSSKHEISTKSSPSVLMTRRSSSKISFGSGRIGSLFCRICHESGPDGHFISPCCCRGSVSRVHKTCLERWLAESDSSHCELCGYTYRTKRVPKYGMITSMFAWLTSASSSRDRRNLLIDLLALIIISPIIGLSTILALQLADSLFIMDSTNKMEQQDVDIDSVRRTEERPVKQTIEVVVTMLSRLGQMGVISMVITVDMAYISWLAMRLQLHVTKWYNWYRRNCKVTLIGYPDLVIRSVRQLSESISVDRISF